MCGDDINEFTLTYYRGVGYSKGELAEEKSYWERRIWR